MAEIITMPRLSDTMEEGTVAQWLKKVGDSVQEGDILAEIETDKATMEFESFHEGVLLHIGIETGGSAPVDALLAIIGEAGEDITGLLDGGAQAASEDAAPAEVQPIQESQPATAEKPEGIEVITMPRLSDTMEEGTVASWLKQVGDTVQEGDILAEIETDKATMEFESFYTGELLFIGIPEGGSAPVDSTLAVIGPNGTAIDAVEKYINSLAEDTPVQTQPSESKVAEPVKPAAVKEVAPAQAAPKVTPAPTVQVTQPQGRIVASPLAKKIAAEKGINLTQVQGSGDHGRIIKRDVENYQPGVGLAAMPQNLEESVTAIANSQMRKTIAKRLAGSKFSAPHYYLGVELNMDAAIAFRAQYNNLPDTKISFNDIVVKATALALKKHPQVNSRWEDQQIVQNHHVHIGVAVAVEDGLVVPVVRFADAQPLPQIGSQVKDYAVRARDKKLKPEEMDGSTFTISNLGMFGISEFTSIINQPNSAILSVGAIVEKPLVKNGQIVVGNTMKLTLACDHRSVDGATGAQFLQTLREYIENPLMLVI